MDDLEQSERVREWLRANGSAITTGLAIGIAGLLGWQWWQGSQSQHRIDAAVTFQALEEAGTSKDDAKLEQLATDLAGQFGNTPYGALGLMRLADAQVAQGKSDAALATLEHAAKVAQAPALAALVRLRLARVQLATGKSQEALDALAKIPAGEYSGLVAEARGDALLALGRTSEAETAYQDALTALETGAPNRSIVEMKLADLGVASEPGA